MFCYLRGDEGNKITLNILRGDTSFRMRSRIICKRMRVKPSSVRQYPIPDADRCVKCKGKSGI